TPARSDGGREHLLCGARLLATAEALRERDGLSPPPDAYLTYDRDVALLREHLGDAGFADAWAEGRTMSFEQAVELALTVAAQASTVESSDSPRKRSPVVSDAHETGAGLARLTPREREVAVLVARGQT